MIGVTKKLIEQFKVGDSVEVYIGQVRGTLTGYRIDAAKGDSKPVAHFEVNLDWEDRHDVVIERSQVAGEQFKVDDLVQVDLGWVRGTLTKYEIDPSKDNMKPAAHFEVNLDDWDGPRDIRIEHFHIEGDEPTLRVPLDQQAYARFTLKPVPTRRP